MRRSIAALLLCILVENANSGAADSYAYAWPLDTPGTSAAYQVELSPQVYAAVTTADLRDVAVVNATGDAVPSAAYRPPGATPIAHDDLIDLPAFSVPAAAAAGTGSAPEALRLQIERGADGKLRRVDADVGAAAAPAAARPDLLLDASGVHVPLAALHVDWTPDSADASAQFAIDGSEDLQQWHPLAARAAVLRLTQGGNVLERHDIALANTRLPYLRVRRLDDGAPLPGLLLRARAAAPSTAVQPARQWLAAIADGADAHHLDRSLPDGGSAWRYHLPAPLAITAIRLELGDDNSLARVHVLSRQRPGDTDPNAWLRRAEFVAFRLRQGDGTIGNDEIPVLPSARSSEWRIESATPLDHAPALSVAFEPDRLVFLAQGQGPFRLVAGSAAARRGDYPLDGALASLRAGAAHDWQPPLATLGARTALGGDSALTAPAIQKPFDWKTWLLWAVLVGAAALIGAMALSLLRKSGE